MKLTGIALAIFLFAAGVKAQSAPDGAILIAAPTASMDRVMASPVFSDALRGALLSSARPAPAPAPQEIQGVLPLTYWQTSAGFTYMRFYELPGAVINTSGFNASMSYFLKPWAAAEGEIDAGVGSQLGKSTQTVFTGGGLRLQMPFSPTLNLWIHGLAGEAHFSPKTTFGGTGAFGYELGGGFDLMPERHKLGYRVGVDLLGTSFFSTYQMSPKVTVGIVYKF